MSKKVEARTTWVMRFHSGQFRGFWGSSGPSQSTRLSFVSCSIGVWSGSLDRCSWSWWPSSDLAGFFSWADSKSAAMLKVGRVEYSITDGNEIHWRVDVLWK